MTLPVTLLSLPLECKGSVLSFLHLEDVLHFASTASASLSDSLPDLYRRRESMKKDLAFSPNWKTESQTEIFGLWETLTAKGPTMDWVKIPSVYERVRDLSEHIPSGHPMAQTIRHMRNDLTQGVVIERRVQQLLTFSDAFALYQRLLRVHKMHAAILSYVIHSNQMEKETAVSLDQYMGDVLCVAYLINQSSLGLVEGSPSNETFLHDMRQLTATKACYLSWVYLHSSILRVKPFTSAQRHRLGISEFHGLSEMVPNDQYINDFFLSSEMTLVFREFGPLGPSFRGRDVVQLREIPARGLFSFLISTDRGVGTTSLNALEWLYQVHEQCRIRRPMTVRPPQVRLALPH